MNNHLESVDEKLEEFVDINSSSESDLDEDSDLMKKINDKKKEIDTMSMCSVASSIYQIDVPELVADHYYWQGKDYSNCYKEDFKELEFFAKGIINASNENKLNYIAIY